MERMAGVTQGIRRRATQLRLIVSDSVDYSNRTARDAGPRYAGALGLPWSQFAALEDTETTHFIFEPGLSDSEVEAVQALIERQSSVVLLKVVDPYWTRDTKGATQSAYVRLIEDCCVRPNVGILSMYEPREWLEELVVQRQPKFLVLPYPYVVEAEEAVRADTFGSRLDKALLAGARSLRQFPRRAKLHWRRFFSKRYRESFDVLNELGAGAVPVLSSYKYCFLCPSRADLEFVKFTECAYAGCVPVGAPASTLPREARELFLDEHAFVEAVRTQPAAKRNREHFDRAQAYRQLMAACRRPDDLREQLNQFARTNF
jgi:hypothetical protein